MNTLLPQRGSKKPGSFFLYNNWGFNAAGVLFEKETGMNIFDAVDSILAKPLQMQDWKREKQRKRGDTTDTVLPTYSMLLSTRDMARVGYLMLRKGKWKDQQIVSEQWVKQITTPVTSYKEIMQYEPKSKPIARMGSGYPVKGLGYGFTWWVWDAGTNKGVYEGAYTAWGYRGQFISILPKLDVVIAIKTKDVYQRVTTWQHYLRFLELLIGARKNMK
jgi:CubicO group peptidase (beta-lactamase class C family)